MAWCKPVSVDNKNLTYDQESLEINSTEWAFSNYAVANSLYLPVPDIINKIQQKGWKSLIPTISPFQKDFGTWFLSDLFYNKLCFRFQ